MALLCGNTKCLDPLVGMPCAAHSRSPPFSQAQQRSCTGDFCDRPAMRRCDLGDTVEILPVVVWSTLPVGELPGRLFHKSFFCECIEFHATSFLCYVTF